MGLTMPASERIRSAPTVGTSPERGGVRPSSPGMIQTGGCSRIRLRLFLGPALAGLVTFVVWGGLAMALGMRGRLALAIAAGSAAYGLACIAFVVFADALGENAEAAGDDLTVEEPWNRH
jgi:hypothetical protein